MEHINESILSEEIKEHQKEARIDHMVYLPGMEALKSDITKQVVEAMEALSLIHISEPTRPY